MVNGGISDSPTKYKSVDDYPLISQTTVIELGEMLSSNRFPLVLKNILYG